MFDILWNVIGNRWECADEVSSPATAIGRLVKNVWGIRLVCKTSLSVSKAPHLLCQVLWVRTTVEIVIEKKKQHTKERRDQVMQTIKMDDKIVSHLFNESD